MEAYTEFASVYDIFMDETPYELWQKRLIEFLTTYGITDGLLVDLGCGSGTMTEHMAASGYDMIGIDFSSEMLQIAMEKREVSNADILYLQQDMREFELYGTVRGIYSICDSINYILELEELEKVFSLVNNYLEPEGIFICDFNTEYKYREVIGATTIAENREDCSFIWENEYDEESKINEYDLTIFTREGELFRRVLETHYQRGYTVEEMVYGMEQGGLKVCTILDADTMSAPCATSERIYVVAQEQGKLRNEQVLEK